MSSSGSRRRRAARGSSRARPDPARSGCATARCSARERVALEPGAYAAADEAPLKQMENISAFCRWAKRTASPAASRPSTSSRRSTVLVPLSSTSASRRATSRRGADHAGRRPAGAVGCVIAMRGVLLSCSRVARGPECMLLGSALAAGRCGWMYGGCRQKHAPEPLPNLNYHRHPGRRFCLQRSTTVSSAGTLERVPLQGDPELRQQNTPEPATFSAGRALCLSPQQHGPSACASR